MSADGAWKITIKTPMGPQEMTANVTTSGDTFSGEANGAFGTQPISGKVSGDTLTWSADITQPMPLTLKFEVHVTGDSMAGTVQLGPFGNGDVSGVRV